MEEMYELRKYIGRDYTTYNCFDLVKEFYSDKFGLTLGYSYDRELVGDRKTVESLIVSNKGDFERADSPQFGDIVIIKLYGIECHIGVYISNGRFLHSARTVGSLLDRIERYERMVSGYYRHRKWA